MGAHVSAVIASFRYAEFGVGEVPWMSDVSTCSSAVLELPTGPDWGRGVVVEAVLARPLQNGDKAPWVPDGHRAKDGGLMSDERDVLAAQEAKFAALVAGDLEALERLLDDGISYVHANGEADDKAQFLRNVAERGYLGVTVGESAVRVMGDVAVVTGLADIHVTPEVRFDARFIDVWHRRDGWRNVAWQSTRTRVG